MNRYTNITFSIKIYSIKICSYVFLLSFKDHKIFYNFYRGRLLITSLCYVPKQNIENKFWLEFPVWCKWLSLNAMDAKRGGQGRYLWSVSMMGLGLNLSFDIKCVRASVYAFSIHLNILKVFATKWLNSNYIHQRKEWIIIISETIFTERYE